MNVTKKEIRLLNGVTYETVHEFILNAGWSLEDNCEMIFVNTDEDREYDQVVVLVEVFNFKIPDDENPKFLFAQEKMSRDFDIAIATEGISYHPKDEIMWDDFDGDVFD